MRELILALLPFIWLVESGGQLHPPAGDNGRSVGPLQIQKCVVKDVNEALGHDAYTYEDRQDLVKSGEMFWVYSVRYATKRRLGHDPTMEDIARIWNGGPNGYKKPSTVKYWNRIQSRMERYD